MNVANHRRKCRIITNGIVISISMVAFATNANSARAQSVVQLPTFHFFSVSTSVSVPDGGDAFLGGVGMASSARTERGIPGFIGQPFTNIATGSTIGAASASVHAEIHDFEALDQALLALAADEHPISPTSDVRRPTLSQPLQSIATIRSQVAAEDAAKEHEAADDLAHARQLLAAGKTSVAKIYLRNALRKSSDSSDVHQQAVFALRGIEQSKTSATLAGQ